MLRPPAGQECVGWDLSELRGESTEEFGIVDVLAQLGYLGDGHSPAEVATVMPALVIEIRVAAHDALAVVGRVFAVFLGNGPGLHGGVGGDLFYEGLPDRFGGSVWRLHHCPRCLGLHTVKVKKQPERWRI